MSSIKKLYHQYIYGVMGTLIFHILLFSGFLISEIDFKQNVRDESYYYRLFYDRGKWKKRWNKWKKKKIRILFRLKMSVVLQ